jgi:arylsulfatase A-like enzyme
MLERFLGRFPALVPAFAATGVLGLGQGLFMYSKYRGMGGGSVEMLAGITRFCLVIGLVSMIVLLPLIWLLRRFHPAWKLADREAASWAVAAGCAAALIAWLITDRYVSDVVSPTLAPWLVTIVSLATGFLASWLQPPRRVRRVLAAFGALALVLALLPFGPGSGPPSGPPEPEEEISAAPPDPSMPDVVLVCIDTLRRDRFGVYGHSPSLTPEMDRFAAEGVTFNRAVAASPWTVPSVASMLTGLPTLEHRAGLAKSSGLAFIRSPLPGDVVTVTERFAAAGYRTYAVVANGFVGPDAGMAQGFDEFLMPVGEAMMGVFLRELPLTRVLLALFADESFGDIRARHITNEALRLLEAEQEERAPIFMWVHYVDPHAPFQADPDSRAENLAPVPVVPKSQEDGTIIGKEFVNTTQVRGGEWWLIPKDRERIATYYDRAVRYLDEHVGRLFTALGERAKTRTVIAALTSDHGEELWDHGGFEHGHDFYREVTQIPLFFWGPGVIPGGLEIDEVVGIVDIPATLAELAGVEPLPLEEPDEGRSLARLWKDGEPEWEPRPRFAEGNLYQLPAALVEDGPWRFILRANDKEELYDVVNDPEERYNVAQAHPEATQRLRQLVAPRLKELLLSEDAGGAELTPEQLDALAALGYVQ